MDEIVKPMSISEGATAKEGVVVPGSQYGAANRADLTRNEERSMAELAYNGNGDPFEVPEKVTGWRVRRMKPRGAPELIYGRDGLPLVIDADAGLDDLRRAVDAPGRYRLEAVGDDQRTVEGVPIAYIQVTEPLEVAAVIKPTGGQDEMVSVMREAMRLNTELARAVVDRFPAMLEASAVLLRAADGAGMPARAPLPIEVANDNDNDNDDDDDDQEETEQAIEVVPTGGFDLNALVAQIVPMVITKVMNGGIDLSNLGALLDWRKAKPKAAASSVARAAEARGAEAQRPQAEARTAGPAASGNVAPATSAAATPAIPTLEPAAMMHFLAIQKALSPDEAALAKEVAKAFSPAELNAWIADLSKLSVPEAVAKIRAIVARGAAGAA